ncbi:hypothetical protein AB0M20_00410 [Actinoplanes sp. NPDC051633]|uniref:hypothetical protein n=1 Tax=Actinoplanes sp. NPDC051633 TaxID=3155670 RepID=UPI00344A3084
MTDSGRRSAAWWNFEFPNNRGASVRPSQDLFRFDVEYDLDDDLDSSEGLTSEQVEQKLIEIANSQPLA